MTAGEMLKVGFVKSVTRDRRGLTFLGSTGGPNYSGAPGVGLCYWLPTLVHSRLN